MRAWCVSSREAVEFWLWGSRFWDWLLILGFDIPVSVFGFGVQYHEFMACFLSLEWCWSWSHVGVASSHSPRRGAVESIGVQNDSLTVWGHVKPRGRFLPRTEAG